MNRTATSKVDSGTRPIGTTRKHINLRGVLQGIGCRPTIYRLAVEHGLVGWVMNAADGVVIEVEGSEDRCSLFVRTLVQSIPFPGHVESMTATDVFPQGESQFRIVASGAGPRSGTPIPPDTAVCPECVEELFTDGNPRYLYPFITCTVCGPRFTVVRSFPYDRERTAMADFTMCDRCRVEYESPLDRRFHSQTNSCPACGPRLWLADSRGKELEGDPIVESIRLLGRGKIIAVKGIGGFHLACDALNDEVVRLLRERKGRAEKPFAVMMRDFDTVSRYCIVGSEEKRLLTLPVAPIVLLQAFGGFPAPRVAPYMGTLGVMLPYSPIHHMLFRHPGVEQDLLPEALVMTSGNHSEEPIAAENAEAFSTLGNIADAFLLHNRDIVLRADDSIFRMIDGRETVFRRSRGVVPQEFKLQGECPGTPLGSSEKTQPAPTILGAGGDLKNCIAVLKRDRVVPGPHVGDLASPVAQEYFARSVVVLSDYLEASPDIIAVDPHPEYFSSTLAAGTNGKVEHVFHHHAHAVSLLFEHGMNGPAVFAVFDGTGYGPDGTIWGGEFLIADRCEFTRAACISPFALPGGEAAIREPVRILSALLACGGFFPDKYLCLLENYGERVNVWLEAVRRGINSPLTSSAGRLFDAAAAAAGFLRSVTFEGEAAMWLEGIADPNEAGAYSVRLIDGDPITVDAFGFMMELADDLLSGTPREKVSARFHNTVAAIVAQTASAMADKSGLTSVGLTGGCFQNRRLTERTAALLRARGLEVLLHGAIPPNDGGIAIGQAVAALARTMRNPSPV